MEIIAVCSEICTKHRNTLCGQNAEMLNVNLGGTHSDREGPSGQGSRGIVNGVSIEWLVQLFHTSDVPGSDLVSETTTTGSSRLTPVPRMPSLPSTFLPFTNHTIIRQNNSIIIRHRD